MRRLGGALFPRDIVRCNAVYIDTWYLIYNGVWLHFWRLSDIKKIMCNDMCYMQIKGYQGSWHLTLAFTFWQHNSLVYILGRNKWSYLHDSHLYHLMLSTNLHAFNFFLFWLSPLCLEVEFSHFVRCSERFVPAYLTTSWQSVCSKRNKAWVLTNNNSSVA